jgi:GNAT superfamily N-acetyltransferase
MDAALLERAIRHSLIIAAYHQGRQIGFARVITDYASFAYLSDVFVLPDWRGHGVGQAMIRAARPTPAAAVAPFSAGFTRCAQLLPPAGLHALADGERYMELQRDGAAAGWRWPFGRRCRPASTAAAA